MSENRTENHPKPPETSGAPRAVVLAIATAGGAGYAPLAPGTFGSAVGVLLYWQLSALGAPLYAVTVAGALFLGIWAAGHAEVEFGCKDDGRIVIDEVVGQLIAYMPLLAFTGPEHGRSLWLLGFGFLSFRLFDIWKPGPVRWAERRFAGGAGVMLDDVAAGALAALTLLPLPIVWEAV